MSNLTRYPYPGKFEGELSIACVLWDNIMFGAGEQYGEDEPVTLLRGPFNVEPDQIVEYDLNANDILYLSTLIGATLYENSQGFVYVGYLETQDELDAIIPDLEMLDEEIEECY